MKRAALKITAISLFALAIVAAPAAETTNAPAGQETTAKHKNTEHSTLPFHGKLKAIDKNAMTLTVGDRTFEITSETKITKDALPATLADGVVGEMVGGAYKKSADGKLTATNIHFGLKSDTTAEVKAKKKNADNMGTSTNGMTK